MLPVSIQFSYPFQEDCNLNHWCLCEWYQQIYVSGRREDFYEIRAKAIVFICLFLFAIMRRIVTNIYCNQSFLKAIGEYFWGRGRKKQMVKKNSLFACCTRLKYSPFQFGGWI